MSTPLRGLAAGVLLAALALPSVAAAAPGATTPRFVLPRIAPTLLRAPQGRALRGLLHGLQPASRSNAALTITDPAQLAVPLPANAIKPATGTVDLKFLDDKTQNPFAGFNPATYASAGALGGYAEAAALPVSSATDTITVLYVATYYDTADHAAARVTSTVQAFTSKGLTDGSTTPGYHLFALAAGTNPTDTVVLYFVFSSGNAVGEVAVLTTQDQLTKEQSAIIQAGGSFLSGVSTLFGLSMGSGSGTGSGTPTVTIAGAGLAHRVKGKVKATKVLKWGEKGIFVADVQFTNADTSSESATITFSARGHTLGTKAMANVGTQTDGSVVFGAIQKFKTKKNVKITAQITVQDGAVQAQQSFTFKVKKK